jgi:hypothetical protein
MAHTEATKESSVPETIVYSWRVPMQPRNMPMAKWIDVEVQATSKQEAINKALSQRPGHTWGEVEQLDAVPNGQTIRALLDEKPEYFDGAVAEPGLWANKWEPTRREGEELTLQTIVGEAMGAASMCWNPRPEGIFDSSRANWITGGAIDAIERVMFWQAQAAKKRKGREIKDDIDPQDLIKAQNTDAQLWARAFASQFDLPEEMDSAILSWFASAIETAKDHVRNLPRTTPVEKPETLTMLQAAAAKYLYIALDNSLPVNAEGVLNEHMTRAWNAGYQSHADDIMAKAIPELEVNQAGFDEWADKVEQAPVAAECGMAEEPEEAKQWRLQRDADKASVIDLILHYKNPADEETRMRQIRVVME